MKKFLAFIIFLSIPTLIFAATKPATPSATAPATVQNKIDDLKERLATKVAELRKSSPMAIFGTVTQVSVSSMTVDTVQKAYKIDLTDDITVAQLIRGKRTKLTLDDISKNDVVTVFGDYDDTLDLLSAKKVFIEASTIGHRIHGIIDTIDKKTNSFTLKGIDNTEYTVDVESTTKNNTWTSAGGIEKSGFSKLESGMFVTVVGVEDPNVADRFSASRILTIKLANASPTPMATTTQEATPTATVKTKLVPSIKPTLSPKPTATPKVTQTP